jgi:hypothetical protein
MLKQLQTSSAFSAIGVLALLAAPAAQASGWTAGLTLHMVADSDYQGEVVQFSVDQPIDNSAGCQNTDTYILRNPNTIKGGLALLTAAFLAGRQVSVFVSGTCDASGRPNVTAVQIL